MSEKESELRGRLAKIIVKALSSYDSRERKMADRGASVVPKITDKKIENAVDAIMAEFEERL